MTNVRPFPADAPPPPVGIIYSEASYFDGYHFQHIAEWEEQRRLKRIRDNCRKLAERRRNRRG